MDGQSAWFSLSLSVFVCVCVCVCVFIVQVHVGIYFDCAYVSISDDTAYPYADTGTHKHTDSHIET